MTVKSTFTKLTGCLILLLTFLSAGCSKPETVEEISDKIDKTTTETAHKITRKIKSPINKARNTKDLGDERLKSIEDAMKNQ